MKVWRNLLICVVLVTAFLLGYNRYLTVQVAQNYNRTIDTDYGNSVKNKSIVLQQTSLNNGDTLIFGSSELNSGVDQNPRGFFPNSAMSALVNSIGQAGVMDLEQTLNIGSLDYSKNDKIVYMVSFPWFYTGLDSNTFCANFSELKFCEYMTNSQISDEYKKYMAARVSLLAYNFSSMSSVDAWAYAKMCAVCPSAFQIIQTASYPVLEAKKFMLGIKDKCQSLSYMQQSKPYTAPASLTQIDWQAQDQKALQQGQQQIHNTEDKFYFNDTYYSLIADKLGKMKDSMKTADLTDTPEYADYKLFLETCKAKHVKPLIVVQSVNGWFYDYMGVSQSRRQQVYDKLCSMAQDYGFTAVDLSSLEYEPYAYSDIYHLAWRGWLYVDQKIADYYS